MARQFSLFLELTALLLIFMLIKIKNLRLRCIIGIFDWERKHKQDVVLNIILHFDGNKAALSDQIEDTVDYKKLNKQIISLVENSEFQLIEKMAEEVMALIKQDNRVFKASVEIEKPAALRFADSVSVETFWER